MPGIAFAAVSATAFTMAASNCGTAGNTRTPPTAGA
jgi:hypothetical protein